MLNYAGVKVRNNNCDGDSEYYVIPTTQLIAGGGTYPGFDQISFVPNTIVNEAGDEFQAVAVGNISGTMYDYWKITHTKEMQNVEGTVDGIGI